MRPVERWTERERGANIEVARLVGRCHFTTRRPSVGQGVWQGSRLVTGRLESALSRQVFRRLSTGGPGHERGLPPSHEPAGPEMPGTEVSYS